jgi:anti-sigma28 factor (negative regulator of flagellin synthesis)
VLRPGSGPPPLDADLDDRLDGRHKRLKRVSQGSMEGVKEAKIQTLNPHERGSMRANDEQLAAVQRKVSRGEYEINSQRVAVAILERIGVMQTDVRKLEGGHALLPGLNAPREV